MSEVRQKLAEIETETTETTEETQTEATEPQYTEAELEAKDAGWNPEGQDKDGNSLSADEYMARKPLFNKIRNQGEQIHNQGEELAEVRRDMKIITQSFIKEKEDLVEQLKAERETALTNLDTDEVRKLDKQIETASTTTQETDNFNADEWKKPYFTFIKENSWYGTNTALKSAADLIANDYSKSHPQASPEQLYDHIAVEMKREFPDMLDKKEEKLNSQSKVSSSTRRTSVNESKTQEVKLSDFDPDEQQLYIVMAKARGKTVEDYLNPKRGKKDVRK